MDCCRLLQKLLVTLLGGIPHLDIIKSNVFGLYNSKCENDCIVIRHF